MLKKIIFLVLIFGLLAGGYIVWKINHINPLHQAIEKACNTDSSKLNVNLPPNKGRMPGAILAPMDKSFLVYSEGVKNETELLKGEKFSTKAVLNDTFILNGIIDSDIFSTIAENSTNVSIELNIENANVFEMKIPNLKKLITENKLVKNAMRTKEVQPIIVYKSYKGIVTYTIHAKNEIGLKALNDLNEIWSELDGHVSANFNFTENIQSKKKLQFGINSPIVFAYEAMQAKTVLNDLSGDAVSIKLTPINSTLIENIAQENSKNVKKLDKQSWGLITISNSHYDNFDLDVPEAGNGANLVNKVLKQYRPQYHKQISSFNDKSLSEEKLLMKTIDITMDLLENPVEHLVIYYSGHGLSLPNGEQILLMGDIQKDYAERSLTIGQYDDRSNSDGLLQVEKLYKAFEMAGVEFTLIIDACYPNQEMQDTLTRVNMMMGSPDGSNLDYFGNQPLITDELSEVASTISRIGQRFEYRMTDNVVIFSSKPGAKALFVDNPINPYGLKLPVLAAKILENGYLRKVPLGQLIKQSIDTSNGLGEISLQGSITWSNLESMENTLKKIKK